MLGGPPLKDLWSLKDFLPVDGLWKLSQGLGSLTSGATRSGPSWAQPGRPAWKAQHFALGVWR